MIDGAHMVIYSTDAEADRAFLRDTLGFPHIDAGHGWLIFALPPSEVAVHPAETGGGHELYLMCGDLDATMAGLAAKGVACDEPLSVGWGRLTAFKLPGGGTLKLYQPRHERPEFEATR